MWKLYDESASPPFAAANCLLIDFPFGFRTSDILIVIYKEKQ